MKKSGIPRRLLSLILVLIMVLSLGACDGSNDPGEQNDPPVSSSDPVDVGSGKVVEGLFTECGELSVKGSHLVDESGNICVLKGVSTHGIAWYPQYVSKETFTELRDEWNVNTVRLAMYTAEYNGYCTGDEANREKLRELVCSGVDYATELGMYVIVDWHILSDNDPNTYKSEAIEFFSFMSEKYADNGNVIYEICNEPNSGTSWNSVKSYAVDVIAAIRKYDKDGVIIVGCPTWSQDIDKVAADPIKGEENIIYSLHYYSSTHGDWLRDRLRAAVDSGLPVFVSEFGVSDASGNGEIDVAEAYAWIDLLDELSISRCIWSLCNKDESSALIGSDCTKLSGWADADLKLSGRWYKGVMTDNRIEYEAPVTELTAFNDNGIKADVSISNSWYDGKYYYLQCDIAVCNEGKKAISGWSLTVNFTHDISQEQLPWNGSFAYEGNSVKVSSVKSNAEIPAGASARNIGFIIKSTENVKLESMFMD